MLTLLSLLLLLVVAVVVAIVDFVAIPKRLPGLLSMGCQALSQAARQLLFVVVVWAALLQVDQDVARRIVGFFGCCSVPPSRHNPEDA